MKDLQVLRHEPRVTEGVSIAFNRSIPGSNELDGLIQLLSSLPGRLDLAIEIGSYRGVSTEAILHFCTRLIAIDVWPDGLERAKREFDARFSTEKNVSYLRMPSAHAADLFRDHVADLVYIDAEHSYAGVLSDIRSWLPKVKPGKWIAGHDYDDRIGDVPRAVNEVFGRPDAVFPDTSWLVQVPSTAW